MNEIKHLFPTCVLRKEPVMIGMIEVPPVSHDGVWVTNSSHEDEAAPSTAKVNPTDCSDRV
jgi:hypothetical protein